MIKKIFGISLLSVLLSQGQFFEEIIPLPEDSPGVNYIVGLTYNWINNKLYLTDRPEGFAILEGGSLRTIKRVAIMAFGSIHSKTEWIPQINRVYLPSYIGFKSNKYYIVFDGARDIIIDTLWVPINGLYPQRIIYNENNHLLYINYHSPFVPESGGIAVVEPESNTILTNLHTLGRPFYLALNPINNHLYAACLVRNESLGRDYYRFQLNIFDCRTHQLIDTRIKGREWAYKWPSGDLLYNPISNKIYFNALTSILVIDCTNDSVIAEIPSMGNYRLLFNYRNNKIYTSNDNDSVVIIIDCQRDSIIKVIRDRWVSCEWEWIELGVYNWRENKIYLVTEYGDTYPFPQKLTVIDGESDSIVAEEEFFINQLCYDGNHNLLYCIPDRSRHRSPPKIVVIDGRSNQIVDTLVTGSFLSGSIIWNPLNNKLYFTTYNQWEEPVRGQMIVLDGQTHRFLKEIPLGITGGDEGFFTVNTRRNKIYYTTYEVDGRIIVIDSERDTIVKVIQLIYPAGRLDYNPINDKVYCANWSNGLVVIDGNSDTIITYVPLPFTLYCALIWHPGVNKVYCGQGGMVAVIDGATNQLLKIVPGPSYPRQIKYAYNLKNNKLYITYYDYLGVGGLGIFDCIRDTFIGFIPFGMSIGVDWNAEDNKVYFSAYNDREGDRIGVVDGTTDSLIRIISVPSYLYQLIWNPKNNKIYAVCDPGGCLVIDCENDSLLEIPLLREGNEGFAQPLAVNLENGRVYLASPEMSRIFVFKGTPSSLKTFPEEVKIGLRVCPNPGKKLINIQYSPLKGKIAKFRIYDAIGRLVKDFSPLKGEGEIILSEADFPFSSGIYILRIETKDKSFTQKFIWLR